MIGEDLSFCDQNLQFVAIFLAKNFHFSFFNFNSSFFLNIFHCNIPLGRGFPTPPNSLNKLKWPKKLVQLIKNRTLVTPLQKY